MVTILDSAFANVCLSLYPKDILIERRNAITSLMVNPLMPYHLAVGCEDSYARIYDMRAICTKRERSHFVRSGKRSSGMISMLKPPDLKKKACRVTSLRYKYVNFTVFSSVCIRHQVPAFNAYRRAET